MLKSLPNPLGLLNRSKPASPSGDNKSAPQTSVATVATSPKPSPEKKTEKTRPDGKTSIKDRKKSGESAAPVAAKSAPAPAISSVVNGRVQVQISETDKAKTSAEKYRDTYANIPAAGLYVDSSSIENVELIINSAYKQVFGNAHIMESERLVTLDSQMRNRQIPVLEFIRGLAQSDLYKSMFWEKYPNVTAIELNFKHLLGRAPNSAAEISQHIQIIAAGGFEAEIDSYLDSDEYVQAFGEYQVPYPRGYTTQTGKNVVGFTHSFSLLGTACSSNKSSPACNSSDTYANVMQNTPGTIPPLNPIPDSFPEELIIGPEPRIPLEWKSMARELLRTRESYQREYERMRSYVR